MSTPTPSLTELAKTVTAAATALEAALKAHNLKQPSFGPDGLDTYPHDPEIQMVKMQLGDAVDDLSYLVNGPHEVFGGDTVAASHSPFSGKGHTDFDLLIENPRSHCSESIQPIQLLGRRPTHLLRPHRLHCEDSRSS
jgi:hypothetical protein